MERSTSLPLQNGHPSSVHINLEDPSEWVSKPRWKRREREVKLLSSRSFGIREMGCSPVGCGCTQTFFKQLLSCIRYSLFFIILMVFISKRGNLFFVPLKNLILRWNIYTGRCGKQENKYLIHEMNANLGSLAILIQENIWQANSPSVLLKRS